MTESEFVTRINLIAESHNCRTVFIDPDNRLINLEGPDEAQVACAIEISEVMGSINEVVEIDEPGEVIREVKDGVGWII